MKVGIVGCGRIATLVHMPSLQKMEGYDLAAAADVHPARLREAQERFRVNEVYEDYRRMLVKADIDTVFVCTPPKYHFHIVMDAIEWGKHVFCEKPLASNVEEALAIRKALQMKQQTMPEPLFLMPAHNFIFTPCFNEALRLLAKGRIGRLRRIHGCSATNLRFYSARTDFRTQAKCGVLEDLLPHLIYLVHEVAGPLEQVSCIEPHLKRGTIDNVDVNVELANEVRASLTARWTGLVPTLRLDLLGETGEIRMDLLKTPYNITVVNDGQSKTTHMGRRLRQYFDVFRYKHPSYTSEHLHFLHCIKEKTEPRVTVDHGIELVRTLSEITACYMGKGSARNSEAETVAILRAGNDVEATVQKSIDLVGGLGVKKDHQVVIKPNVCFPQNFENKVITDPRVLEAVLNIVGQKSKNVIVVESDAFSGTAEKRLTSTGVMDVIKKCDAEFLNLSKDEVEEHEVAGFTLRIPKTAIRADYFINLPKVKTHTFSTVSVAMKNMFGVLANKHKSKLHKHLTDVLVYINKILPQDLIVADGIVAMEGLGPIHGKKVDLGLIISGRNPVAVDSICCHIADFNPYAVESLWKAHQQGLGEIDLQQIQVLGEKIDDVKGKFNRPSYSPKNIIDAVKSQFRVRFLK